MQLPWLHIALVVISVAASFAMFTLAWHYTLKQRIAGASLLGIGFLPVALLDLCHILSYPYMPTFVTANGFAKATAFWVTGRLWLGLTLAFVIFFSTATIMKTRRWYSTVAGLYLGLTVFLTLTPQVIPGSYDADLGLSPPLLFLASLAIILHVIAVIRFAQIHKTLGLPSAQKFATSMLLSSLAIVAFLFSKSASDLPVLISHLLQAVAYSIAAHSLFNLIVDQAREELARSHEALRKTEHLAILGLMSGRLAHEVRNPLTAMRACAQLGQMQTSEEKAQRMFGRIITQVDQLNDLVSTSLGFARLNSGELQVLDIRALLEDVVQTWRPEAAARQVQVKTEYDAKPLPATVRAGLLRQAIGNIVLNALQAMGPGGVLTVQASAAGTYVNVAISDTGPGIPADIQPRLFEEFVTTKENGTGLGLPITREIINTHGGRLSFSTKKSGTTFLLTLPLSDESAEQQTNNVSNV